MKKAVFALAAVAAMYAPMSSYASDGTITFSGALTATTCLVNGGSNSMAVTLPTLPTTSMTPGPTTNFAGSTPFQISVSGCTAGAQALTLFEGGSINSNGRLRNTAVGPANVDLQLLNAADQSPIDLTKGSGDQGVTAVTLSSGAATANFLVRYFLTDSNTINAGSVGATVNYTMSYF